MQFTVPIPHADKPGVAITVEAGSLAQATAKAYRVHADASYEALSPADKLLVDKWAAARKRILAAT